MKNNTINKKEIEKFSKIAEDWWDPNGKFKPLHKFNPIRIKYIRDTILSEFKIKKRYEPFKGLSILDIGCGGGLLSEPMAKLGADVVGIDASSKNIQVAKYHLKKTRLKIILEIFLILSIEPTEVPPNFSTTIFIDIFFFKFKILR